ncbi:hypothetical protein L2750_14620 [Shewanella submarina]|uniref:Uncharacterized protein n=1 Tax=Shewanella submarina TaxID=2016376 RepID=A0ABV7G9G5_9GAMM|nr:hypothetical protein [Shewanella submarina]MCL1038365.1 hypothetical protein [Shewanella submarina]
MRYYRGLRKTEVGNSEHKIAEAIKASSVVVHERAAGLIVVAMRPKRKTKLTVGNDIIDSHKTTDSLIAYIVKQLG